MAQGGQKVSGALASPVALPFVRRERELERGRPPSRVTVSHKGEAVSGLRRRPGQAFLAEGGRRRLTPEHPWGHAAREGRRPAAARKPARGAARTRARSAINGALSRRAATTLRGAASSGGAARTPVAAARQGPAKPLRGCKELASN